MWAANGNLTYKNWQGVGKITIYRCCITLTLTYLPMISLTHLWAHHSLLILAQLATTLQQHPFSVLLILSSQSPWKYCYPFSKILIKSNLLILLPHAYSPISPMVPFSMELFASIDTLGISINNKGNTSMYLTLCPLAVCSWDKIFQGPCEEASGPWSPPGTSLLTSLPFHCPFYIPQKRHNVQQLVCFASQFPARKLAVELPVPIKKSPLLQSFSPTHQSAVCYP